MKRFLFVLLIIVVLLVPMQSAKAFGEPPAGLAGTITVISKNANSVTLLAEQTGGSLVMLTLESFCYQVDPITGVETYAGMEKVRFSDGSETKTFNLGPRTYHGNYLVPTTCWSYLVYYFSSSRAVILAGLTTLP